MSERKGMTVVSVSREKFIEQVRQPVRIDDKGLHPCRNQMIERKSDQRFLKNRYERLWQVIGQRSQPFAETCGQDKCLCDCGHEEKLVIPPAYAKATARQATSFGMTQCRLAGAGY